MTVFPSAFPSGWPVCDSLRRGLQETHQDQESNQELFSWLLEGIRSLISKDISKRCFWLTMLWLLLSSHYQLLPLMICHFAQAVCTAHWLA